MGFTVHSTLLKDFGINPNELIHFDFMKNIILLVCLTGQFLIAQTSSDKQIIAQFEKSFKTRDVSLLKSLVSDDFSIGAMFHSDVDFVVNAIYKAYSPLDSLKFVKKSKKDGKTELQLAYFFNNKKNKESALILDAENKIVSIAFFDALYNVNRDAEVKKITSIPFEIINNAIAIKIKFNKSDKDFVMLYDTGADGMALTPESAMEAGIVVDANQESKVVGGKSQVQFSKNNTIRVGNQVIPNQGLVVFPTISRGFDGLFGGNLMRKFITKINFDTKTIDLYNFGKFKYEGTGKGIEFDYSRKIPIIKTNLTFDDDKVVEGDFILDTGADYNLICFGPFAEKNKLQQGFNVDFASTNFSMGHQTGIVSGDLKTLSVNGFNFNHVNIALQEYDPTNSSWATESGSIGMGILKKFNYTFNLLDRKVYLEPNQNFSKPLDFYLKGLYLGLDGQNELIVKKVIQGSKAESLGIKAGAKIIRFNDFENKDFLNQKTIDSMKGIQNQDIDIIIEQSNESLPITF